MIDAAKSDGEADPRLWAPFVVVGRASKIQVRRVRQSPAYSLVLEFHAAPNNIGTKCECRLAALITDIGWTPD